MTYSFDDQTGETGLVLLGRVGKFAFYMPTNQVVHLAVQDLRCMNFNLNKFVKLSWTKA